eukprot:TRINITY_DN11556_c0_g1_i1.p1 TRINITY_DN11556_c0_g1~~TRINITY_DN11556_c0_g1_i1.p1  ORF type:complete len:416 (+),score=83.37 TRINITY_DN11556_c0_g1_i1:75-1322(+)
MLPSTKGLVFREFSEGAVREIDAFVHALLPTEETIRKREDVFQSLSKLFSDHIRFVKSYLMGSFPLHCFLPDGDVDITVFLDDKEAADQTRAVLNTIEGVLHSKNHKFSGEIRPPFVVKGRVLVVKCSMSSIPVDITAHQASALATACVIEDMNRLFGRSHILKRCLLLCKAWCYYESRILASHHGMLSTFALTILTVHLLNRFGDRIKSPLHFLSLFLQYYMKFPFDKYGVAVQGCFELDSTVPVSSGESPHVRLHMFETPQIRHEMMGEVVERYHRMGAAFSGDRVFTWKKMNISDPILWKNNLGKSVSLGGFVRIMGTFRQGNEMLDHFCANCMGRDSHSSIVQHIFPYSVEKLALQIPLEETFDENSWDVLEADKDRLHQQLVDATGLATGIGEVPLREEAVKESETEEDA